jgi:hypothetical protein
MSVNILENLSNVVFIGAYWVKDILWLRLLAMLGSLVIIPYYYLLEAKPLWTPIMWSVVFISIHATRAWGIVKERRPVAFTGDEQFLYDKTFSTLSPPSSSNGFWRLASGRTSTAGTCSIPPASCRIPLRRSSAASWRLAETGAY